MILETITAAKEKANMLRTSALSVMEYNRDSTHIWIIIVHKRRVHLEFLVKIAELTLRIEYIIWLVL